MRTNKVEFELNAQHSLCVCVHCTAISHREGNMPHSGGGVFSKVLFVTIDPLPPPILAFETCMSRQSWLERMTVRGTMAGLGPWE